MKYYTIAYPDENDNPITETLSEAEILKQYWDYWSGKMIQKYGKEEFEKNWCEQDCIDDWVIVHWAVESTP